MKIIQKLRIANFLNTLQTRTALAFIPLLRAFDISKICLKFEINRETAQYCRSELVGQSNEEESRLFQAAILNRHPWCRRRSLPIIQDDEEATQWGKVREGVRLVCCRGDQPPSRASKLEHSLMGPVPGRICSDFVSPTFKRILCRNKHGRGHVKRVRCESSGAMVPKDKVGALGFADKQPLNRDYITHTYVDVPDSCFACRR
jgi:hypothetical protein